MLALTKTRTYFLTIILFLITVAGHTQIKPDSLPRPVSVNGTNVANLKMSKDRKADSLRRLNSPRKAAIHSAILPGWGQADNHKYWKIPIVYAGIGIPTGIFIYNLSWYKKLRFAYTVLSTHDTSNYGNVDPKLQGYIQFNNTSGLQYLRNEFRRNVDFSALFIMLFWALNVVDASVDAHLKTFDVSPDLSLRFKAGYSEMANTAGVSLVLHIK